MPRWVALDSSSPRTVLAFIVAGTFNVNVRRGGAAAIVSSSFLWSKVRKQAAECCTNVTTLAFLFIEEKHKSVFFCSVDGVMFGLFVCLFEKQRTKRGRLDVFFIARSVGRIIMKERGWDWLSDRWIDLI